ncbi:fatty acid desaturase family protein [Puniceibacterium sp. IMCC21224]|uniref:fatty acid desaturase family protein n=1 Tax=Puniceibacterium sp. IMCC21224 TaxID=1618204 RepID=UPI00064D92BB|nr:fatty acid desaturase family protein [Puniceibacterium sp. IMCC21224]KMK66837.1 fatty acid desaturase [Puniceibacterium sp. IMCC21224]
MSSDVRTPITQAMNDGALTRRELKALMIRSDRPALTRVAGFVLLLVIASLLIWFAQGHWWIMPAMFLQGIVIVHLFALQHECVHYTAFKTRKLNDVFGNLCGYAIILPNQQFRYEHCNHHTYTQLKGQDPELIELPISIWKYLWYISSVPYWQNKFRQIARNAPGQLNDEDRTFLSKYEAPIIIREARLMVAFYAVLGLICLATGWTGPLWYWLLPLFLGEPVMRFIRLTEHVGRPNVDDMAENTRTSLVSKPMQFLSWNMNFHAEHHYAASVPFHALPQLHKKLHGYVHVEERGYLGAHIDIVKQLTGRKPRSDTQAPNA